MAAYLSSDVTKGVFSSRAGVGHSRSASGLCSWSYFFAQGSLN